MAWYDTFASFYDASLERLYRESRTAAVTFAGFEPGQVVLDLPCGTGQSLDLLRDAVGPDGRVVGVDRSEGMLKAASVRVAREGWDNVELRSGDAREVELDGVTAAFCALGLSAFPDWERVLDRLCTMPSGSPMAVFDVRSERWNPQKPIVELMAQADLTRPIAEALEARTMDYRHQWLPGSPWQFGGRLFVAAGRVP